MRGHAFAVYAFLLMVPSLILALRLARLNGGMTLNGILYQRLMEEQINLYPQIQEFEAFGLAYILLRAGKRDEALRVFGDNVELLETRFRDDYTDRDPLLAETLFVYAELTEAAGDRERANALRAKAAVWAPGRVWSQRASAIR